MEASISRYLLQLRREHPFFAMLSLFARYRFSAEVTRIQCEGIDIIVNPNYFAGLPTQERCGLLLHASLHSALLHGLRRGQRDPAVWQIAADIVVNNLIVESCVFQPPSGTAQEPCYRDLSVEQVYERLCAELGHSVQNFNDATGTSDSDGLGQSGMSTSERLQQRYPCHTDLVVKPLGRDPRQNAAIRSHWRGALIRSDTTRRLNQQTAGYLPAGLLRELDVVRDPPIDWRTQLWRFMACTPCDYVGYDRRFMHRGLYLEQLDSESLNIHIAIDTSASIRAKLLGQFMGEVESILASHHHIQAMLYFIDAEVAGPYALSRISTVPKPVGGGGTSFDRFFAFLDDGHWVDVNTLVIYLTDGFGEFPQSIPECPVLWVVTLGGADKEAFPFGEVLRLAQLPDDPV